MKTLAERIKSEREAKGWTKAELMRRSGVKSASTITELENGTIKDSPQLPLIANALGVETLWLQFEKGPKVKGDAPPIPLNAIDIAEAFATLSEPRQNAIRDHLMALLAVQKAEQQEAP